MKLSKLLFLITIISGTAMASLPEMIYLETPTLAITTNYYYAIDQGKLWHKSNTQNHPDGEIQNWKLFRETGLPFHRKTLEPLAGDNKLINVFADGDVICVIDETDRIYLHQTGSRPVPVDTPYNWGDAWGAPFANEMYIPRNTRGMTITRRSANTIGYMEDRIGNKIKGGGEGPINENGQGSFGGLIHIYLLSEDGAEINYADTGLPTGFGYRYSTPLRGRFIAENIAGSGSIVFLIGETGRIFSKPLDFDMNGNNPMMYNYSYYPVENDEYDGDNEDRFGFVNLPAIPWNEEPEIPMWGLRAITKEISMLSTGKGNAQRELRVQGRNEVGLYGYYHKQIFTQDEWDFTVTNIPFKNDEILVSTFNKKEFQLGAKKDMYFSGKMKIKQLFGEKKITADVLNYNLVDSPATIRITLPTKEQFNILLHTVDMWTMQSLDDPGRDGSPKLSFGTVEIPQNVLSTNNKRIRRFLEKYLIKAHLAEFRFNIMASTEFVVIESRDGNIPIKWHFGNSEIPDPGKINGYLPFINNTEYLLKEYHSKDAIKKAISENKKLLHKYSELLVDIKKQSLLQTATSAGVAVVEHLPVIRWIDEWSVFPAPKKLFRWGPALIYKRADLLKKLSKDLKEVIKIIEARILSYEALL